MSEQAPHTLGREAMWSKTNPFLQIAWDSTSLSSYMQCSRRYKYEIIDGWRPKVLSADILFGKIIHEACGAYDIRRLEGDDHQTALRFAVRHALKLARGGVTDPITGEALPSLDACDDDKKTTHTVVRCLVWWADEFGEDDALETQRLTNGRPAVELSFRMPLGFTSQSGEEFILCGHFDSVVKYADRLYIRERKTTKTTLGGFFFERFAPNTQVSNYALASKAVLPEPAAGVMIEAFQTAKTMARSERYISPRTLPYLDEWLRDIETWIRRAEADANAGYWPKNETACGLHGGCPFRRICSKDPGVREMYLKGEFQRLSWDPLSNR